MPNPRVLLIVPKVSPTERFFEIASFSAFVLVRITLGMIAGYIIWSILSAM